MMGKAREEEPYFHNNKFDTTKFNIDRVCTFHKLLQVTFPSIKSDKLGYCAYVVNNSLTQAYSNHGNVGGRCIVVC